MSEPAAVVQPRRGPIRHLGTGGMLVALVLLGAACRSYKPPPEAAATTSSTAPASADGSTPPTSTSGLPTTTRRTAPTTRPIPTTPQTEPPPPSRESGGPCLTDELRVEPVEIRSVGAALVERFRLTNVGSRGCTLTGYPSVAPYAASSMQAQVGPIPPGDGPTGAPGTTRLLGLGETAVFFLRWTPTSPPAFCQSPEGILFAAPGDTLPPTRVPFAITFCGRLLRVSVVLPTDTAG